MLNILRRGALASIAVHLSLLPSNDATSGTLQSVTLPADSSARTRTELWHPARWLRASCPGELSQLLTDSHKTHHIFD